MLSADDGFRGALKNAEESVGSAAAEGREKRSPVSIKSPRALAGRALGDLKIPTATPFPGVEAWRGATIFKLPGLAGNG
jgi:hypothetical protein